MKKLLCFILLATIATTPSAWAWSKSAASGYGQGIGNSRLKESNELNLLGGNIVTQVEDAKNGKLTNNMQSCSIFGASSTSQAGQDGSGLSATLNGTTSSTSTGTVQGECNFITNNHL